MTELPRAARSYWMVVTTTAIAILAVAGMELARSAPSFSTHEWISFGALACLAFVGERMAIPLITFDEEPASHSIGSVIAIAAIVVLPWYAAVPLLPFAIGWSQRRRPLTKTLFNVAHSTISIAAAAFVFAWAGGPGALTASGPKGALGALATMVAISAVYYGASSALVSTMVALASRQRIRDVYRANHMKTVLQEVTTIGLGLMLGGFCLYNAIFAPLVALPVVMAYFSIETFVRIQQETRDAVLEMAKSIDLRDSATREHSKRVARLSVALAHELGLSHEQVDNIELSALVHDIGKIGIPNEILNKPGKLSAEERVQMEAHPVIGYEMLRHYKQFRKGLGIVKWHHERWDGTGYPDRIPGPQVPLEARIVCIADAFEAMTADRPYRKAMSVQVAYGRLAEAAGSQFDPHLVPVFRVALERVQEMPPLGDQPTPVQPEEPMAAEAPAPQPVAVVRPIYPHRVHGIRRLPPSSRCRPGGLAPHVEGDA